MRFLAALMLMMPTMVSAQVFITEIMYDLSEGSDSGREWIEVHNAGNETVDLSKWKLVESGKNHKISRVRGNLDAGTYVIITDNPTKFAVDHPEYSGALFDSAFSLSNDGETLSLVAPEGVVVDEVKYIKDDGGSGTGDSLQRIDLEARVFAPGEPTLGAGIPEGGLVKSPQLPKGNKQEVVSPASISIQGERAPRAGASIAAVSAAETPPAIWWLGVGMIAMAGASGLVMARRHRETEWEIIEET